MSRELFMADLLERLRKAVGEQYACDADDQVEAVVQLLSDRGVLDRRYEQFERGLAGQPGAAE